jgi:hypothetical protein
MGKQLVNFIIYGCESSAPFLWIAKRTQTHAVLVIGLYELRLGNPSTKLIQPPGPSNANRETKHKTLIVLPRQFVVFSEYSSFPYQDKLPQLYIYYIVYRER